MKFAGKEFQKIQFGRRQEMRGIEIVFLALLTRKVESCQKLKIMNKCAFHDVAGQNLRESGSECS